MVFEHGIADRDVDPAHDAGGGGGDFVLHFHRFHDQQQLALADCFALLHVQADDRALHRFSDRDHAVGGFLCDGRGRGFGDFAQSDDGQGVFGFQADAGGARGRGGGFEIQARLGFGGASHERGDFLLDEAGVNLERQEARVAQNGLQKRNIRRCANDPEFRQCPAGARGDIGQAAGGGRYDGLGQQ